MTKTQAELIERAKKNGGCSSVTAGSGRGARGGRVAFGSRERTALFALEQAGKVVIVDHFKDVDYNAGNAVHSTTIAYKLVA